MENFNGTTLTESPSDQFTEARFNPRPDQIMEAYAKERLSESSKYETYYCPSGCCNVRIKKPQFRKGINDWCSRKDEKMSSKKRIRAGGFIYNKETGKVLFVIVRGMYWGLPKGGVRIGETNKQGALREVYEETGIRLADLNESKAYKVDSTVTYYPVEMPFCVKTTPENVDDNDAIGLGWVNPKCAQDLIDIIPNGGRLTRHVHRCVKHFMNTTI